MTHYVKNLLIATMLMIIGNTAHGYTWTMNNFTKKTLLVQVELKYSKNPYFVLIPPRQSADFSWEPGNAMAGFCLGKIKYLVVPSELLMNKNLFSCITKTSGSRECTIISNEKIGKFLEITPFPEFQRKEAELRFMPDALFNQTVEEAKKLSGTDVGAKIVGWFADMVAQSKCRSRDIKIIERKAKKTDVIGDIGFYTLAN
jgi:hypothetical protein